jgi:dihydroorotate dehydrogenase (NAD+) catalytic subunit
MVNLGFSIGDLHFKNPVLTASGTFGYGSEFDDFLDVSRLGGIIVKGTTLEPREGNFYPRMAETPCGMLNAVGLQNKGFDYFEKHIYPRLSEYNTNIIVNINGNYIEEYVALAEKINKLTNIPAIELNISCPNVKMGGMAFGTNTASAREVTKAVRAIYTKKLIVKLSPNVTSIVDFARIAEEEGADAVSLINTLLGMSIDIRKMKPSL